jgi:hypothetical protein
MARRAVSSDTGKQSRRQIDVDEESDEEFEDGQAALLEEALRPRAGLNPHELGRQIAAGASDPHDDGDYER